MNLIIMWLQGALLYVPTCSKLLKPALYLVNIEEHLEAKEPDIFLIKTLQFCGQKCLLDDREEGKDETGVGWQKCYNSRHSEQKIVRMHSMLNLEKDELQQQRTEQFHCCQPRREWEAAVDTQLSKVNWKCIPWSAESHFLQKTEVAGQQQHESMYPVSK